MDRALTYDLDQQISILELQKADTVYRWADSKTVWCKAEQTGKNLFSTVGIGAKSVKFTVWKQSITLYNAFRWHGRFCFLTDLTEIDRMYYEIMAAMVEPRTCELMQADKTMDQSLHRPVYSEPQPVLTFPACLIEKYMGFTRLAPQSQATESYVLVTAKAISLSLADLIRIDGTTYNVQIIHGLDEFKNEYEIAVTKEA